MIKFVTNKAYKLTGERGSEVSVYYLESRKVSNGRIFHCFISQKPVEPNINVAYLIEDSNVLTDGVTILPMSIGRILLDDVSLSEDKGERLNSQLTRILNEAGAAA